MNHLPLIGAVCRLILVGDSTLEEGTGYGSALCAEVAGQCSNFAVGGTSSTSFREQGYWGKAKSQIKPGDVVLIEFGHNDRWSKSINNAVEYEQALISYIGETRIRDGIPILVTPLAERRFINGTLFDDLAPWAHRTEVVATRLGVPVLSLHSDAAREIMRLGPVKSMKLAQVPPRSEQLDEAKTGTSPRLSLDGHGPRFDYTHLGPEGAARTSRIVRTELSQLGWGGCFRQ